MTAGTHAGGLALTAEARTAPASAVIPALHRALYAALYPRADGSRHDRNCINRHVNAVARSCSDACRYATAAVLLAEDWETDR